MTRKKNERKTYQHPDPLFKRKRGRPKFSFKLKPYSEAREIVRNEVIESSNQYYIWWELNSPSGIPKRPDRVYGHRGDWKGWGDYLGIYNQKAGLQKTFRSYEDCKMFTHKLGFTNKTDWIAYAKTPAKPKDIPSRPDIKYQKTGEWISWKDFLGYTALDKLEQEKKKVQILYMIKQSWTPANVFKMNILHGAKSELSQVEVTTNGKLYKAYSYTNTEG